MADHIPPPQPDSQPYLPPTPAPPMKDHPLKALLAKVGLPALVLGILAMLVLYW
jgi:hypothetical protein